MTAAVLEHRCTPAKWEIIETHEIRSSSWRCTSAGKVIVQKCTKCGLIRSEKYPTCGGAGRAHARPPGVAGT